MRSFSLNVISGLDFQPWPSLDPGADRTEENRDPCRPRHRQPTRAGNRAGRHTGVWRDRKNPADKGKRIWTHPQRDGSDIDLAVMTTNTVPDLPDGRVVDFHELYWAHLMSETKAVAVLLWLYELCPQGSDHEARHERALVGRGDLPVPDESRFAVLVLQGSLLFSQNVARSCWSRRSCCCSPACCWASSSPGAMEGVPSHQVARMVLCVGRNRHHCRSISSSRNLRRAMRDVPDGAEIFTLVALPTLIAWLASFSHGTSGIACVFWRAIVDFGGRALASSLASIGYWHPETAFAVTLIKAWLWGLNSPWSVGSGVGRDRALSDRQCRVPAAVSRRCRALFPQFTGQRGGAAGDQDRGRGSRSSVCTPPASTTASSSSRTASGPSSPTTCCAPISAGSATSCRRSKSWARTSTISTAPHGSRKMPSGID